MARDPDWAERLGATYVALFGGADTLDVALAGDEDAVEAHLDMDAAAADSSDVDDTEGDKAEGRDGEGPGNGGFSAPYSPD